LTGTLQEEMKELKSRYSEMKESLENAQAESQACQKQLREFKFKYGLLLKEVNQTRTHF
jgi:predicted nuclease with TOPRIM domain